MRPMIVAAFAAAALSTSASAQHEPHPARAFIASTAGAGL